MTLGYTSAQRKEIVTFICKNCEYEQHQCFKCGELEPSDKENAKVFRCNDASCGHFYHPKCIAELLETDDTRGACELEKRIMAGMSFTCPVHWCFKCGHMEDKAESAFQLAACRRCPKSYHRNCLPREISLFKMKQKTKEHGVTTSGWKHRQINFFYCPDHIDDSTQKFRQDDMEFTSIPETRKIGELAKKKVKLTGKRKNHKDQLSTRSTVPSKRSHQKEREHNQSVATKSSSDPSFLEPEDAASEQIITKTDCTTKRLEEDMQFKPCGVKATADLSHLRAVGGLEKESGTSFAAGRTHMTTSYIVGSDSEKRVTSTTEKEISSEVLHVSTNYLMPSRRNVFHHSMKENMETSGKNGHQCVMQNTVSVDQKQDIIVDNPLVDGDAKWDSENCRLSEDKDDNGSEETTENYLGIERGHPNKDTFEENNEKNGVFDNLILERQTEEDDCNIHTGKHEVMEWGKTVSAQDPPSQPAEEISCKGNPMFGNECEQDSRSEENKIAMTDSNKSCSHDGGSLIDTSDEHGSEKQVHGTYNDNLNTVSTDARQEFCCFENHEDDEIRAGLKEPNSSHCNDNAMDMARERRGDKDGKVQLDASRKCNHIENSITIHPLVLSSHQCLPNHEELDGMDTQLNHLQCNDQNRAAKISEDKLSERIVRNRRGELSMHNIRDTLYNSPSRGYAQEISRNHSVEWQSMYYCDSLHETNYQYGYEQVYYQDCSCIDYFTCRKYYPQLDYNGVIKYGGYHAMDVDPSLRFSLEDNNNTAFRPCTDTTVGGIVYDGRNSWEPQVSVVSVKERCGPNLGADPGGIHWVPRRPLPAGTSLRTGEGGKKKKMKRGGPHPYNFYVHPPLSAR